MRNTPNTWIRMAIPFEIIGETKMEVQMWTQQLPLSKLHMTINEVQTVQTKSNLSTP